MMKAEQFLQHMKSSMPTRDELEQHGLSDDEIADICRSFTCESRAEGSARVYASELERMVDRYDCSHLEVGLVRFTAKPRDFTNGVQVGYVEADPLVVRSDGSVVAYDHSQRECIAFECAGDGERFLDAMSLFVSFRQNHERRGGQAAEVARKCADAAGGPRFESFFSSICAFFGENDDDPRGDFEEATPR